MWQEEFELFLQYRHDYKAGKKTGEKKKGELEINVKTSDIHLHFCRLTQPGWFLSRAEHTVLLTHFFLFLNETVKSWWPVLLPSPPEFPAVWGRAACAAEPLLRAFTSIQTGGITTWPCLLDPLHPLSSSCFCEPARTNLLKFQNYCSALQNRVPEVTTVGKAARCDLCYSKLPSALTGWVPWPTSLSPPSRLGKSLWYFWALSVLTAVRALL